MSQDHLISTDLQSLEVSESFVDLYEIEYTSKKILRFHPGVDATVRVLSVSGSTIKLNTIQTLSDNSSLTFTGVNAATGATQTKTALVNGAVTNNNTVTVDTISGQTATSGWSGNIEAGMVVTGTDIKNDEYGEVVFNGNVYYGYPIAMDAVEIANDGAMNRPTLTLANAESILRTTSTFQNSFSAAFAEGSTATGLEGFKVDKLVGKRVTKRRTLAKYLSINSGQSTDAAATKDLIELPKNVYIIDRVVDKTALSITIELASPFDLSGLRVPAREVIGKYCSWIYQGKNYPVTKPDATGTVHNSGSASATLTGVGTEFKAELAVGDRILIGGEYLRTISAIANDDSTITLKSNVPAIANGSGSSSVEAGPMTFALAPAQKRGGCSWSLNGAAKYNISDTDYAYRVYYTQNDEPIIFFGVTHTYSGGTWSRRTSASAPQIKPLQWSPGMTLAVNDIVYTTDTEVSPAYELFWLYQGAAGAVNSDPAKNSISWQRIRHYSGWTDREYNVNATNNLRNDYVLYPMRTFDTEDSIGYVDTSTVWRNTASLPTSSGEKPSAGSLYWGTGDACGKLLISCKKRYQFLPRTVANSETFTVESTERDTNAILPFGGFPGSRKFR